MRYSFKESEGENLSLAQTWQSVTQLNEQIRDLLEETFPFARVQGEISDLSQPPSGHLYFTLIDKQSRIRAVVWRSTRQRFRFMPRAGDAVRITGRIAVYPPRGEYQLVVEAMQPGGAGNEREQFLRLHAQLKAEGLFEASRKKSLPFLPEVIGVVTSASGAAIHDIIQILDHRFPGYQLLLAHAQVQGEGAVVEIITALQSLIEDGRSQVIICGRGGGSAEDLAAFNSEHLVRAIAASPIPIVSAVGHEVDLTLADLVADARAPTPSAAAERVMPEKKGLIAILERLKQRLTQAMLVNLKSQRHLVHSLEQRLLHPRRKIEFFKIRCDELTQRLLFVERQILRHHRHRLVDRENRLARAIRFHISQHHNRHNNLQGRLANVSPLAILQRGYAIVYDQHGAVSRGTHALHLGEKLRVRLADGEVLAKIIQLNEKR